MKQYKQPQIRQFHGCPNQFRIHKHRDNKFVLSHIGVNYKIPI